jgi:hypothetical protein
LSICYEITQTRNKKIVCFNVWSSIST